MDRLNLWAIPIFALIAFILVTTLSRLSRFTVRDDLSILTGHWELYSGYLEGSNAPITIGPHQPDGPFGSDDDGTFLNFMALHEENQTGDFERRMAAFYKYCDAKRSAVYWAQFVRRTSEVAYVNPDKLPPLSSDQQRMLGLLIDACDKGWALDANNAIFPIIKVAALMRLGKNAEADVAFLKASRLSGWNEYITFEPNLRFAYLQRQVGYPGEAAHARILDSTLYPHISVVRSAVRALVKPNRLADRLAAARVGDLLIRLSPSYIGVRVGRSIVCIAVGSDPRDNGGEQPSAGVILAQAKALEAKAPTDRELPLIAQDAAKTKGDLGQVLAADEDVDALLHSAAPACSAWMLAAGLAMPLALGLAWLKGRYSLFATASPYFALLLLFGEKGDHSGTISPLIAGFSFLLFIPALVPKISRYIDLIVVASAVVALGFSQGGGWVVSCELLFLFSLLVERRFPELRTAWAALIFAGGCLAVGWVWTYLVLTWPDSAGHNAWICALACLIAVPYGRVLKPALWVGMASVVIGLGFAFATEQCMANDHILHVVNQQFMTEGSVVRQESGISSN